MSTTGAPSRRSALSLIGMRFFRGGNSKPRIVAVDSPLSNLSNRPRLDLLNEKDFTVEELLLGQQGYSLVFALFQVAKRTEHHKTALIAHFNRLFEAYGRIDNLVLELLSAELEEVTERKLQHSTLFREESVCMAVLSRYLSENGGSYLRLVLQPTLKKLAALPDVDLRTSASSSTNTMPETSKLSNSASLERFAAKLAKTAKALLNTLYETIDHLPWLLRLMVTAAYFSLRRIGTLSEDEVEAISGTMLFLRYICPAIVSPHVYGVVAEEPNPALVRKCVLLSKILQNLNNKVSFDGSKERHMCVFDSFVSAQSSNLSLYFAKLRDIPCSPRAVYSRPAQHTGIPKVDDQDEEEECLRRRAITQLEKSRMRTSADDVTQLLHDEVMKRTHARTIIGGLIFDCSNFVQSLRFVASSLVEHQGEVRCMLQNPAFFNLKMSRLCSPASATSPEEAQKMARRARISCHLSNSSITAALASVGAQSNLPANRGFETENSLFSEILTHKITRTTLREEDVNSSENNITSNNSSLSYSTCSQVTLSPSSQAESAPIDCPSLSDSVFTPRSLEGSLCSVDSTESPRVFSGEEKAPESSKTTSNEFSTASVERELRADAPESSQLTCVATAENSNCSSHESESCQETSVEIVNTSRERNKEPPNNDANGSAETEKTSLCVTILESSPTHSDEISESSQNLGTCVEGPPLSPSSFA